jgi:uncharacterized membrane protein YecN with MAPEG domain
VLQGCGIALVAGRLLHAWGLWRSNGSSPGRVAGQALTWIAIAVLAVRDLAAAI